MVAGLPAAHHAGPYPEGNQQVIATTLPSQTPPLPLRTSPVPDATVSRVNTPLTTREACCPHWVTHGTGREDGPRITTSRTLPFWNTSLWWCSQGLSAPVRARFAVEGGR